MHESVLLSRLNAIIERQEARAWLDGAARRLQQKMDQQPRLDIAFEVVPRTVVTPPLPTLSAWVFILRRGRASGAERHPNSTQRMAALRGDDEQRRDPLFGPGRRGSALERDATCGHQRIARVLELSNSERETLHKRLETGRKRSPHIATMLLELEFKGVVRSLPGKTYALA